MLNDQKLLVLHSDLNDFFVMDKSKYQSMCQLTSANGSAGAGVTSPPAWLLHRPLGTSQGCWHSFNGSRVSSLYGRLRRQRSGFKMVAQPGKEARLVWIGRLYGLRHGDKAGLIENVRLRFRDFSTHNSTGSHFASQTFPSAAREIELLPSGRFESSSQAPRSTQIF